MAKKLQLRRGTTSQHSSFTGAVGEVTVDTDKKVVVVHDGSTAGGIPLSKASDAAELIDEDDFSSNTATKAPSQQSTKAYIAATSQPLDADLTSLAGCQTGAAAALAALTSTEVAIIDGATLTTTELNYVDGVTSAIQTQLDAKGDAKLATTQTFSGTKSFDAVKVAKGAIHDIGSSPGATITIDFTNGNNQKVTLSADCTFANPTTEVAGQSGSIFIAQPGGANHSITGWGTQFHFAGSDPSNTETNGAVDRLDYIVYEADKIHCVLTKDIAS